MAKVQLTNVTVLDNPSPFMNPFQFEITFDCIEDLPNGKIYRPEIGCHNSVSFAFRGNVCTLRYPSVCLSSLCL
jgi:hypothetical protein